MTCTHRSHRVANGMFAWAMFSPIWLLTTIAVVAIGSDVAAAPIYGGATRQVSGGAGPNGSPGVGETKQPSFGSLAPWADTATAVYSNAGGSASASAFQSSAIDASGVTMLGTLSAAATLGYAGNAQSILNVSFTLLEPTPYTSQVMGSPFVFSFASSGASFAANSSGILPIGNYGLQVRFQESAGPLPAAIESNYQYSLTFVPEPSTCCLAAFGSLMLAACLRRKGHCSCSDAKQ